MPAGSSVADQEKQAAEEREGQNLKGRDAVEDAATAPRGEDGKPTVSPGTERGALDFLLAPPKQHEYRVPVKYETDDGPKDYVFVIVSLSGRQLRDIERRNTKDGALGPLAEMDDQKIAAETVSAALRAIEDPGTGASISPRDPAFMVNARGEKLIDPSMALEARFEFQSGVLQNLASEVRRISGWSSDRVGTAQRVMVDAVGSSLSDVD